MGDNDEASIVLDVYADIEPNLESIGLVGVAYCMSPFPHILVFPDTPNTVTRRAIMQELYSSYDADFPLYIADSFEITYLKHGFKHAVISPVRRRYYRGLFLVLLTFIFLKIVSDAHFNCSASQIMP